MYATNFRPTAHSRHLLHKQKRSTARRLAIKTQTVVLISIICCLKATPSVAQTDFMGSVALKFDSLFNTTQSSKSKNVLYNNTTPGSLMIPTGFGGSGTYIYGGLGGVYPEQYRNNEVDFIAFGGVSFGNPAKFVNVSIGLNMTDLSEFRNFSGNFSISRLLPSGSSVSVGGLQLFASKNLSDSPGSTFYAAFSHAVQGIPSKTKGASALVYTLGLGTGRFRDKSLADVANGKGEHGTSVFAGVSYEIIRYVNLNAEWYGTNLGISAGVRPFKTPLSFGLGAANLIPSYSGDRVSMVFMVGFPLSVNRFLK